MRLLKVEKSSLPKTKLHEKYIVPPFSVINTHAPYFRERLNMWRELGVYNHNGRDQRLAYDNRRMNKKAGRDNTEENNGTSKFNPVIAEIMYKWFLPYEQATIFDPFSGGITRGAVAAMLGHNYVGQDINQNQIESNIDSYNGLCNKYRIPGGAFYKCADSSISVDNKWFDSFDMVFTCPPYYNLERYTDLDNDLSNQQDYKRFLFLYKNCLQNASECLKDNSFFVIVVSEIRDLKNGGEFYGFVPITQYILDKLGLHYYNEIILYNDTGNLAITSGNYMDTSRKVGRQHQNILVYYKGDLKAIKNKFKKF